MQAESRIEDRPTAASPFAAPLSDARIYQTEATRQTLGELRQRLHDAATVLLLEGEHGSGRSTLLRLLRGQVADEFATCLVEARLTLGEHHVLGHVAAVFGGRPSGDAAALAAELAGRGGDGRPLLIVVDNADRLSPFALRALFELRDGIVRHGGRLNLVLSAEPGALEGTLALPAFAGWCDEGITRIAMPRFSEQETADYLRYRIEAAGMADRIAFDKARVRRLFRASRGLPRHIDRLADDLLNDRPLQPYQGPGAWRQARRRRHLLAGGVVTGLAAAAIALLASFVTGPQPGAPALPHAAFEGMPERLPESRAGQDVPAASTPAAAIPAPARETQAAPPTPPPVEETLTGRAWLMAQDPGRFTVQLASTPDRAGAEAFIRRHELDDTTAIATRRGGGGTRYLIVHGSFPDVTEARLAAATLPRALRRNDPFARSMQSLREIAIEP